MPKGSEYRLEKSRLYHFPHNSALYEEFDFMLHALDPKKTGQRVYTFGEMCKISLVEQIKSNKFKLFHRKPYAIFTRKPPPDFDTLLGRLSRNKAKKIAENRRMAFKRFLGNPSKNYDDFVEVQYKPTKTWRQNWVEFVRDYADLAAYCGLLPAFYKNPLGDSEEDGYVISDMCIKYLDGKADPTHVMMGMKYANSSINLMRYPQFNIRVRPFYSALKLLTELEKQGVKMIDKKLLGAAVGCLRTEEEIPEAATLLCREYKRDVVASFSYRSRTPSDFLREGERFSLSLVAFLNHWELVRIIEGRANFVRITDKGKELIHKTPPNALFYNFLVDHVKPTPLLGFLLNAFCENVGKGITELDYDPLISQLSSVVEEEDVSNALEIVRSELNPSPIQFIRGSRIKLNNITFQYSVTPSADFASSTEAAFIEHGVASVIVALPKMIAKYPPESMMKEIRSTALASEGSKYEDILAEVIEKLNVGKVKRLGHIHAGQRYTDIVWELPILESITGQEKILLIIMEAKSGNAIRQFDERIAISDIINTLKDRYNRTLPKVAGLWVWVIDGSSLPSSSATHGGARPGSKTFQEKMNEILQLMAYTGRLVVVTAFNVESFIQYYSYLYGTMMEVNPPLTEVNMPNFWIWGKAFRPLNGYVFICDDANEMRRKLMMTS